MLRRTTGATALCALALIAARSEGAERALGVPIVLTPTSYLVDPSAPERRYRLEAHPGLTLLRRHREPSVERPPEWRTFFAGRTLFDAALSWSPTTCESGESVGATPGLMGLQLSLDAWMSPPTLEGFDLLAWLPKAPEVLPVSVERACPWWKKPKPVTFVRNDSETDRFALVDCDGAIAPDALDRLSVLARPPDTPRPQLPLPEEPAMAERGEWAPWVKLLHPRLLWVVARLSQVFPGKAIVLASGYRPQDESTLHGRGRALDLELRGVDKQLVYAECRKLRDVGCGYYPNHPFVHIDVRPYGTGHPTWIDVSNPGEPSRYVDALP